MVRYINHFYLNHNISRTGTCDNVTSFVRNRDSDNYHSLGCEIFDCRKVLSVLDRKSRRRASSGNENLMVNCNIFLISKKMKER